MSWLRIDDGFARHPKVTALTLKQRWIWMDLLCYCARYDTDGYLPENITEHISGCTVKYLARCSELGLIDVVGGALQVHDWKTYAPKDPTGAERQATWRRKRNGLVTEDVTADVTEDSSTGPSTSRAGTARVPVPSRPENPKGFSYIVGIWLSLAPPLIHHRDGIQTSSKAQRAVEKGLKAYGPDDVAGAVRNYAAVLGSPTHYFNHKWTLPEFFSRGIHKFVDEAEPLTNYAAKAGPQRDRGMTFEQILSMNGGEDEDEPRALPFRSVA